MTTRELMDSLYPLTITADRYDGTYSGGRYVAWNLDACDIPDDPFSGDVICMEFWDGGHRGYLCGVGDTVGEAVANLYIAMLRKEKGYDT